MNSTTTTGALTARAVLYGDEAGAGALGRSLGQAISERGTAHGVLLGARSFTRSSLEAVDVEIGRVAAGLLELDLGEVLIAGWRKYTAITDAARRTVHSPGSTEVVELATHRLTSAYRPHVDLMLGETTLKKIELALVLTFDVVGLAAIVREGCLVGLRGGDCLVSATLDLDSARLVSREHRVDPELVVTLDPPVALVGGAATEESLSTR